MDKTVVDFQFLNKKYSVRLKGFTLNNDQFYSIIKDYTDRLLSEHRNVGEALEDMKKSMQEDDDGNKKLVLKDLDFQTVPNLTT